MRSRGFAVTAAMAFCLAAFSAPALATHDHAKETGKDGACVILAQYGNEKNVVLPDSVFDNNPNADLQWKGNTARSHPLHVLVHKGKPGEMHDYWVYGAESDAHCTEYINADRRA